MGVPSQSQLRAVDGAWRLALTPAQGKWFVSVERRPPGTARAPGLHDVDLASRGIYEPIHSERRVGCDRRPPIDRRLRPWIAKSIHTIAGEAARSTRLRHRCCPTAKRPTGIAGRTSMIARSPCALARRRSGRYPFSMDGSDRCMDNTRIEQPWPSLKYEATYLHETTEGFTARGPTAAPGASSRTPATMRKVAASCRFLHGRRYCAFDAGCRCFCPAKECTTDESRTRQAMTKESDFKNWLEQGGAKAAMRTLRTSPIRPIPELDPTDWQLNTRRGGRHAVPNACRDSGRCLKTGAWTILAFSRGPHSSTHDIPPRDYGRLHRISTDRRSWRIQPNALRQCVKCAEYVMSVPARSTLFGAFDAGYVVFARRKASPQLTRIKDTTGHDKGK